MVDCPTIITREWLENNLEPRDTCTYALDLFDQEWPNGAEVTEDNLHRAAGLGFGLTRLAKLLLPRLAYADYQAKRAPQLADYYAKRAPLDADYQAKCAPLYADYQAKRDLLDADYEAKCAPLYADYEAKRALLHADYESKRDPLLISILWAAIKPTPLNSEEN